MADLAGPALSNSLAADLSGVVESLAALESDFTPASVRSARTAVRRVRSNLSAFGSVFDEEWVLRVRADLEPIGESLAVLVRRDAIHQLVMEVGYGSSGRGGVTHALEQSIAARQADIDHARAILDGPSGSRFRAMATPSIASGPPLNDHPAAHAWLPLHDVLPGFVRKPVRNVRRAAGQAAEPRRLERIRRTTRHTLYAAETAVPFLGEPAVRLSSKARDLGAVLRVHRDCCGLAEWLTEAPRRLPVAFTDAVEGLRNSAVLQIETTLGPLIAGLVAAGEELQVPATAPIVHAAGGLVCRTSGLETTVLLVHRRRSMEWSIPKGKAAAGESMEVCAVREVAEETGLTCEVGRELVAVEYRDGRGFRREVTYFAMSEVHGGQAEPLAEGDEVDAVAWFTLGAAMQRVRKERDRRVLEAWGGR